MKDVFVRIGEVFKEFQPIGVLEILLFAIIFYYLFRVLKTNNVKGLIAVFVVFVIATGAVYIGNPALSGYSYLLFPFLFVAGLLIVFNVEVKRDILNINAPKFHSEKTNHQQVVSKDDVERYINDIIKALQNMSKDNIGALIILANDNLPAQVLESGVILDADISAQLIEGIFFPKAPLHDGAMVINNYKIQAAGCFLPLTQNVNIPKELGTRHRAGIGVTETSNVTALIVSEETGVITIAQRGKISRYADYDALRHALNEYYWKDLSADGRRKL